MRDEQNLSDESDQRILAQMRRAPAGHSTAVQLARHTGLPLAEVQRRLRQLQRYGFVVRSPATGYPAFQLAQRLAQRKVEQESGPAAPGSRPAARVTVR